jgi:hypothetical protein
VPVSTRYDERDVTTVSDTSTEESRQRIARRYCLFALAGAAGMFVAWCALDFCLVRFAPTRITDFDWVLCWLPFVVALAGILTFRDAGFGMSIVMSATAAVLASIVAVMLVVFLGIPFHLSIGGKL